MRMSIETSSDFPSTDALESTLGSASAAIHRMPDMQSIL